MGNPIKLINIGRKIPFLFELAFTITLLIPLFIFLMFFASMIASVLSGVPTAALICCCISQNPHIQHALLLKHLLSTLFSSSTSSIRSLLLRWSLSFGSYAAQKMYEYKNKSRSVQKNWRNLSQFATKPIPTRIMSILNIINVNALFALPLFLTFVAIKSGIVRDHGHSLIVSTSPT